MRWLIFIVGIITIANLVMYASLIFVILPKYVPYVDNTELGYIAKRGATYVYLNPKNNGFFVSDNLTQVIDSIPGIAVYYGDTVSWTGPDGVFKITEIGYFGIKAENITIGK